MKIRIAISGILLIVLIIVGYFYFDENEIEQFFLAHDKPMISLLNEQSEKSDFVRGTKVIFWGEKEIIDEQEYYVVTIDNSDYYVLEKNLVKDISQVVLENKLFVRTSATVYYDFNSPKIKGFVKKGEELIIEGYDMLLDNGEVLMYQIVYNDEKGYVYGKYLVESEDLALANYDEEGNYLTHKRRNSVFGGSAANLDFFPRQKPVFEDNVMPDEVRALYLTINSVRNIESYIEFAKENNINGLVIDIKDNTMPGYKSPVMEKYSITNYERAANSFEGYQNAIKKALEADLYLIGRITVFKDSFFVNDNPDSAILNLETGEALIHNNSRWPTAFDRLVWEFNVKLAIEAVLEMGFHEIQFDYIRFPDRIDRLERENKIDFKNNFGEEKAQVIQSFLMYATDEIHQVGAYVSADVFGESAHNYVTHYGQYWGAISNVVDVISAMPYPDHFSAYEYGFKEIVWTIPYELLKTWGEFAQNRQNEIPTPAVSRTWIQVYNAIRAPRIVYDDQKVAEQIKALYETGHTGGFMTWNSAASLRKYEEVKAAFNKEYER